MGQRDDQPPLARQHVATLPRCSRPALARTLRASSRLRQPARLADTAPRREPGLDTDLFTWLRAHRAGTASTRSAVKAWLAGWDRAAGRGALEFESDPNAEGFYLRMGARKIGEQVSDFQAGRILPVMRFDLDGR